MSVFGKAIRRYDPMTSHLSLVRPQWRAFCSCGWRSSRVSYKGAHQWRLHHQHPITIIPVRLPRKISP